MAKEKKQHKKSAEEGSHEIEMNMTPMIDIVFQLLIFFVLTANFIETEGELRSYLPKNRGNQPTVATQIDLANVTVFLDWRGDPETGSCFAITTNFQPASGGTEPRHEFSSVPGGPAGYPANKAEVVDYEYPNFNEIKEYIRFRRDSYSGIGFGLPVTVNFTDRVPIQMVVNMVDICVDLGIKDFALNAQGVE